MGLEPETTVDFGKLNAAERTALSLLAQGHTAKSIANLTDRSVGAVNERLRYHAIGRVVAFQVR
jgi:DNA-binding NarL/FixJ family response regulator